MYAITHIENTHFQSSFHISTPVHKARVTTKQTAIWKFTLTKTLTSQFFTLDKSVIYKFLNTVVIQNMH